MRITSKGQVTIPIEIRERLGLFPETEVEFRVADGHVEIHKAKGRSGRGRALVERLRGSGAVQMTTDEIMALTRGD